MKKKKEMDDRCPRKLDDLPCTYCPLAVLRLKALRNTQTEPTDEKESLLPGCDWAVNHQMSNYCFFKYAKEYLDKPPSDIEIAHMNNISIDTVKKVEKEAMAKVKESSMIKDMEKVFAEGESVIDWNDDDDMEHNIIY